MRYHFTKDKLTTTKGTKNTIEFLKISDYDKNNLTLPVNLANDLKKKHKINKLDIYEKFWYLKLSLPKTSFSSSNDFINFLVYPNQVYTIYNDDIDLNKLINLVNEEYNNFHLKSTEPTIIIFLIINLIMENDNLDLLEIQEKIDDLEDRLIKENYDNYHENILKIRNRLVTLRKRYFSLNQVMYTIMNEELGKKELRKHIVLITNNANRIYHEVNSLIEHTTSIQEMYVSIITTKMNNAMNFFTIISAIFLPLSLIVAWYGMNFKQPETEFEHSYLFIIIICLIVLIFSILYMRKRGFLKR